MRKTVLLIAGLTAMSAVWAGEPAPVKEGPLAGRHGAMMEQHRNNMDELNLTEAQKVQVKALRQKHQAEMEALREKHRGDMRAILTPEQQKKFDAQHAGKQAQRHEKMKNVREKHEKRLNKARE